MVDMLHRSRGTALLPFPIDALRILTCYLRIVYHSARVYDYEQVYNLKRFWNLEVWIV